jgi:hypothetical protein
MNTPHLLHISALAQLEAQLARVDDWQFDSFALAEASEGRPLSTLAFFLMQRNGLTRRVSSVRVSKRSRATCVCVCVRARVRLVI